MDAYGPTEVTVWSTSHRVLPGTGPVPIGVPIDNTQAYVVDGQNRLAPAEVPGQLLLGGAGLAKGYLGKAKQTAERFITIPAIGEGRLYCTGDLAMLRASGELEILGRSASRVLTRKTEACSEW